jgi:C_GCAxxG_C_C family probable redox protein
MNNGEDKVMERRIEAAVYSFRGGFNCAQAVFSTYAPEVGIDREDALRISCGFGAGIGRMQNVCGALSGGCMLIGCKHGKTRKEDDEARETTYRLVRDFAKAFQTVHGTLSCRDLLGCDLTTTEGHDYYLANNLRETKCVQYVRESARWVETMLFERD